MRREVGGEIITDTTARMLERGESARLTRTHWCVFILTDQPDEIGEIMVAAAMPATQMGRFLEGVASLDETSTPELLLSLRSYAEGFLEAWRRNSPAAESDD